MKTKIMQQENPKGQGVQQHLERPGENKTFCGRKYNEHWHSLSYDFDMEKDHLDGPEGHISCTNCTRAARKWMAIESHKRGIGRDAL